MRTLNPLNRYLYPQARYVFWLWLAAGVLLVIGTGLAALAYQQHRLVDKMTVRNDKLLALQAVPAAPTASRLEQEEQKHWAQLKTEREFPWAPVFQAVERVASPDIELLEFKPDKPNRRIALRGEARNRKALIAYLGSLSTQFGLSNVYLTHQQTVARDTLETIAFEIKATLVESP
jgi:hypothetical protein